MNYKETIKKLIANHKAAIKERKGKIELKQNPQLIEEQSDKYSKEIKQELVKLREYYDALEKVTKALKGHVSDITDDQFTTAIYILATHNLQTLNSIFTLAENKGASSPSLIRVVKEINAQIDLFRMEFKKGDRRNLDEWLCGEIISHGAFRKAKADEASIALGKDKAEKLKADTLNVYRLESQMTHNSYAALLENISPYTEDFDYSGHTQHERTIHMLKYTKGTMDNFAIVLKGVFAHMENGDKTRDEIDRLMKEYE